jgi:5-methylcytosine-specific restriction endonuclease McrA
MKKKGKFIPCLLCEKKVWKMPCHYSKYKTTFCSKKHHLEWMKKEAFHFPCGVCGEAVYTQPAQLKYRARSTCSTACRSVLARRRAEKRRQEFGYTKHQLDRLARYSPEAEKWRKAVFERDDYTCQECGVRGTYLEADHIKPFGFFPELRYELSNGRTLCRPCHDKTKISAKAMRALYLNNGVQNHSEEKI